MFKPGDIVKYAPDPYRPWLYRVVEVVTYTGHEPTVICSGIGPGQHGFKASELVKAG